MARVASVSNDLMLASRVQESLAAAGHHVVPAHSLAGVPADGVDLVVADLEAVELADVRGLGVPVLGYYSHVEAETRAAAIEAGVAMAVPRSRMARELPELVAKLIGPSA